MFLVRLEGYASRVGFFLAVLLFSICCCLISWQTAQAGEPVAGPGRYVVQPGDSLFIIGGRHGVTVEELKRLNQLYGDLIFPGQVLTVPARATGLNRYVVKSGDSLFFIARYYGITVTELRSANTLQSDMLFPGQSLVIPVKARPLRDICRERGITAPAKEIDIVVDKSDHTLSLFWRGAWLKTYRAEFGDGGPGDKEVAGDHKTPGGVFTITQKLVLNPPDQYLGSRWMRLGYPNAKDAERGLTQGLIDRQTYNEVVAAAAAGKTPPQYTALGGGIGIHGGSTPEFGADWTWGCVGLANKDVEEFYDYVDIGTRVIIQW
jgi:LysM repeat protein